MLLDPFVEGGISDASHQALRGTNCKFRGLKAVPSWKRLITMPWETLFAKGADATHVVKSCLSPEEAAT